MNKFKDFSKFNKYFFIGIIIFSMIVTGITYAYYSYRYEDSVAIKGNVIAIDATLDVELIAGTNEKMVPLNDSSLSNALNAVDTPNGACIDKYGNLACQVYKITLTNNGSRLQNVKGSIELYAKGSGSVYTNLKWRELTNPTTVKVGSTINSMEKSTLVNELTLESGDSVVYYIAVYIKNLDVDQLNSDKGEFEGIVTFETSSGNTLNSKIRENATLDTNIDFSEISSDTNGKGVYIRSGTENDTNPIYYYRGDVDNNNLIFADTCWKIVRTTETGGTKLIYNGLPSDTGTCNNTGENSRIGISAFNLNSTSPAYVGYMYGSVYTSNSKSMNSVTDTYYYGNDVTYQNGTYTLVDIMSSSNWASIWNVGLNNNHYTCMGSTTCDNVYYIYYTDSDNMYYIELTGGKKVEDALSDMLDNNTNSSTIKDNIDEWYKTNIEDKGYSNYIEDTVWCNDRSIYQLNGWNPDGGITTNEKSYLYFETFDRGTTIFQPNLICSRKFDSFTIDEINGNGDLDYPVGLLTVDEIMLAGGKNGVKNNLYYLNSESYWSISPYGFNDYNTSDMFYVSLSYSLGGLGLHLVIGIRPSISLKPYTEISEGTGTIDDPYVVDTN